MPSQIRWVEGYARAFALVVLDEINLLRRQHSLTPRTISQLKTAYADIEFWYRIRDQNDLRRG